VKYFKPHEFKMGQETVVDGVPVYDRMDPDLLTRLDRARELAGVPMVLTSSWRTPEYNAQVGGKPDSSHLRGLAVDITADTGSRKYSILVGLIRAGFTRIGIGADFIHADTDPDKPAEVIWLY
jgi:uncharacterized protein YcbK (DUF882 family)